MILALKDKNTAPVATGLADPIIAGANMAQSSHFSTKLTEMLAINPLADKLVRYYMTKSQGGIVSLHCMLPYQRVGMRMNGEGQRPTLQRTTVFVGVNCNKNEYNTKDESVHVISESNLAMSELSLNSNGTYNAVIVVGSPTKTYIPYNADKWLTMMQDRTVAEHSNTMTINAFFKLQNLASSLEDPDSESDPETIREEMLSIWSKYQANEQKLVNKGFLIESSIIYADSNAFAPVTTCLQFTKSSNPYLSADKVYGSSEAGASFAPTISLVSASGIITATEAEPVSGYKYGQYSITSTRDNVVVVPEEQKDVTLESTTRELMVNDGSGRSSVMQLTVNDMKRGDRIIKRSTNLASLSVGTPIKVQGKLLLRNRMASCLAVDFRISDPEWTTEGRTNSTEVNAAINVDIDASLDSFDDLFVQSSPEVVTATVSEEQGDLLDPVEAEQQPGSMANF